MVPRNVSPAALGRCLAVEDHGAQADAADEFPHRLGTPRLGAADAAREVHTQEVAGVAAGARGRGGLRRGLRGCGRGRWSHTATGVSPGAFDGRPRTVSGSSALVAFAPKDATSRWHTSTMLMMRLPRYRTVLPAMLAPTMRPCSCAVGSIAWTAGFCEIRSWPSATSPAA